MTNKGFVILCDHQGIVKNVIFRGENEPIFEAGMGTIACVEPQSIEKFLNFLNSLLRTGAVIGWELNFMRSERIVNRSLCGIAHENGFIIAGAETIAGSIELLQKFDNKQYKLSENILWKILKELGAVIQGKQEEFYEDFARINNELAILHRELAKQHKELQNTFEQEHQTRSELERVASQREILFREIQHRVKNNLQVIHSLLSLQESKLTGDLNQQIMQDARRRVHAMWLIHENLFSFQSEGEQVQCEPYIKRLGNELVKAYIIGDKAISLRVDCGDTTVDNRQIIPLGLILNELILNSLKHAFANNDHCEISIMMRSEPEARIEFKYQDNGIGLPENIHPETSSGLGLKLLKMLSHQMDGEMEIDSNQQGMTIRINFAMSLDSKK